MYGVTGATGLIKRGQLVPFSWAFIFLKIKGEFTMVESQTVSILLNRVYGDEDFANANG